MPPMYRRRLTAKDWEAELKGRVLPDVETLEQYQARVSDGLRHAEKFLELVARDRAVPDIGSVQSAHQLAFGAVYPFAGNFRGRGQEVGVNVEEPWQAAFHARIVPELERMTAKVNELLARATSPEEQAQAIALYHEQFERIHPFADGNGRIGRAILDSQVRSLLGREPGPVLDRETYIEALEHAHNTGDLRPLCYATTEVGLPRELAQVTDYKLDLWPAPIEIEVAPGVRVPRSCPDLDTAEDLESAKIGEVLRRRAEAGELAPDAVLLLIPSPGIYTLELEEAVIEAERRAEEERLAREEELENDLSY